MIVPDTTVWIDFSKNIVAPHTDILKREMAGRNIVTTDVIMVEFLQGFRHEHDYIAAEKMMHSLVYRAFWGKRHVRQIAHHYRILRRKGITIRSTIDVIIGTFCLENDFSLLHNDPADFDAMEKYLGLKIVR
ncbi:MAG: VapC toxin family PIN domain ribonuclease [Treponema sp.]|nr:VapC toxin family PIN domain ribonuclease [Treponema sp.]